MNSGGYIAELAVLVDFGPVASPIVQNNFVLLRAETHDDALAAASDRGHQYDDEYINTDGDTVCCRFVGVRNLHEVHEEPEHGAELLYEEFQLSSPEEAAAYVRPKHELAVFRNPRS